MQSILLELYRQLSSCHTCLDDDKKHLLAVAEAWLGLADRVQRPVPEPDATSLHPARFG